MEVKTKKQNYLNINRMDRHNNYNQTVYPGVFFESIQTK